MSVRKFEINININRNT